MRKFIDDRKRDVLFGPAPSRVVSLVPSDTLSLADLGVGGSLVGCTDFCELPAELVGSLPKVGGTKNANVEAILALEPDLVLANQEENTKRDLERLAEAGVRVFISFPKRAAEGVAHLARLARIFRREREPEVVDLLRRGYHALATAEADRGPRLKVFCPIWMKPLMTIHESTFLSDMLRLAGADNVFADRERRYPLAADLGKAPEGDARLRRIVDDPASRGDARLRRLVDDSGRDVRYPRVTLEEVVERDPDVIVLPSEPHSFTAADAEVFAALPGRRRRIVFCDGKDLCWYGSRTVAALPRLRAALHT